MHNQFEPSAERPAKSYDKGEAPQIASSPVLFRLSDEDVIKSCGPPREGFVAGT